MKKLLIALVVVVATTVSCSKETKTATVHKNCTGTYLVVDDKMSRVCNFDLLSDHEEGDEVEVTYKEISSCERYDTLIICMMAFPYDQDIELLSVE